MGNHGVPNLKYLELARTLREEGWYEPATRRMLLELGCHIVVCLGGIAVSVSTGIVAIKAAAFLMSAAGALGIATSTHTASHCATSRHAWLNRFLTYFGYTFFFGTSATYWWYKHCVVHHPTPNLIGIDDDADLMPFFAINENDLRNSRGLRRCLYRAQWVIIPFVIGLNTFNTQRQGWQYLLAILFDRKRRRAGHWIDLGVLALHWGMWVVLPMIFFNPASVLFVYTTEMILLGYAMFIAFAPAHFPAEAACASEDQRDEDFVLRQTVTTVNFRTGLLGGLLCAGVEYQIEHHLFPGIPHVHYPKLSPVVKRYCEENGYPYRTLGWAEAVWKALLVFRWPKRVAGDLRALLPHSPALTLTRANALFEDGLVKVHE
jgi:linoleoyl-CoA desaturase